MRITKTEKEVICFSIYEKDSTAEIYLFGSRADDSKKGGDIDLLIISQKINNKDVRKIRRNIIDKIGEQKIDIVLAIDNSKPFTKIAIKEGILL